MNNAIVHGRHYDSIILSWTEYMEETDVLNISHEWIQKERFLMSRMEGLTYVGDSSLILEPLKNSR